MPIVKSAQREGEGSSVAPLLPLYHSLLLVVNTIKPPFRAETQRGLYPERSVITVISNARDTWDRRFHTVRTKFSGLIRMRHRP
jgi:hypothetical protein